MRCLKRNQVEFRYRPCLDSVELQDQNGNYTGEYAAQEAPLMRGYGNISPEGGSSMVEAFGTLLPYERVIVLEEIPPLLTENAEVWIDDLKSDAPDYFVKAIGHSLNGATITVRRVQVQ